jgi:PKD repeat protein
MRIGGRPVIFEFGLEAWAIDWTRVVASVQGNPMFIFRNPVGWGHVFSSGGYSWGPAGGLAYYDYFYKIAATYPGMITFGDGSKGFNDVLASWSQNRVVDQQCGQTWLNTLADSGKFYSSTKQLPYLQIATWNDYEEGTSIESGIDNCLSVNATISGTTVQWALQGAGLENTIDHYTVFISTDGQNLMPLGDVPTGTYQYDLSALTLGPGNYTLLVKAVAKASLKNQMSAAVSYSIANQPPTAVLSVTPTSGIAPVSVSASTAGSSDADGTIAASQIDFGDGTVVMGSAGTHVYSVPGTYTILAKVTDDLGASSMATSTINVVANQPPKAVLNLTPSSGVAPVNVSASTAGSSDVDGTIAASQIDFGDGTVVIGSSATHSYKLAGTYTVVAKVTDNLGASSTTTKTITVAAPSVTISQPANGSSVNSPVRVTASAVSGLPITGMWVYVDNVGVYSVYAASLSTTLNIAPGKHTLMVKAWDSGGNISVSSVAVTVLSGTSLVRPARTARDAGTIATVTSSAQPSMIDPNQPRAMRLRPVVQP